MCMVKFLIIRFSSIGDIVLTSPVIRCLKQQVEDAEIHFLTKPTFASLMKYNPHVDKLLVLKPKLLDTIEEIKQEQYDYIIDLHKNLRTFIIKNKVSLLSFSFPKLNIQKWLLVNLKINKMPDVHIVDRYFKAVELFDVKNDGRGLELFIPENEEVHINNLPTFLHNGYVAIVVGAKHFTKQIPVKLLVKIIVLNKLPVILLGDKEDKEKANQIIVESDFKEIYNACGNYSILQSASLVKQAKVVLTPDTGLMHIAAAFNKKIVSVWGNTVPEFGMYPYLKNDLYSIFEVKDLPCRPCSKLGFEKCPKKHFNCMMKQDVVSIAKQIKDYYASN